MASNFKISCNNGSTGVTLKLFGDFDGTSAWELINVLKNRSNDTSKVFIQTEGLKTIYPFGLDIFRKPLRVMECPSPEIKLRGI
jgi:stage II sporulation protein AA (anti-sigma F factor antagonist)